MIRAKLSTSALLLAIAAPIYAETALPAAGMSMQAVEGQFGKPASKSPSVGVPPITRWDYGDYVVVFERSTVINSVRLVRAAGSAPVTPAAAPAPAVSPQPSATPAKTPQAPAPATPASITPANEKPSAKATVTVTVKPVGTPAAPATPQGAQPAAPQEATPASSSGEANVQEALNKAAAEKAAEGAPTSAPAPADAPAQTNDGYTFDPETGRIIIK